MTDYGYVRTSTERQSSEAMGREEQIATLMATAQRHGATLKHIYGDALTGATPWSDRPGLSECLAIMEPGDTLWVPYMERLARDLIEQEVIVRMLEQEGKRLRSCNPSEDAFMLGETQDPARVMLRQIMGAVAQYNKSQIVGRMVRAKRLARAHGGWPGGPAPFGFRIVADAQFKRLVPDPKEHGTLWLVRRLSSEGYTLRTMADELNRLGVPSRSGGPWTYSMVRNAKASLLKHGDLLDVKFSEIGVN